MTDGPGEPPPVDGRGDDVRVLGGPVLVADGAGTVALAVVSLVTAIWPREPAELATLAVAGLMLVGGSVAFAVGFLRVVGRSRTEDVDLAGVFYLTRSAPRSVRRAFLGLWFAQISIAVASAPFIRPPFGFLALVYGIGLTTLWASRHATFRPVAEPAPNLDLRRRAADRHDTGGGPP